jgi:transposase
MAQLARGRMRKKLEELEAVLEGQVEEHHRYLLRIQIRRLEVFEKDVAELDKEIDRRLVSYEREHRLLMTIPGVDRVVAAVIIAEMGTEVTAFASPHHLASWVGVCPGSNESAGKRKSGKTRKGNAHLRAHLVQAGLSAGRTRGTYLKDKYWRLKARRGAKRAQVAIAHKIIVAAYHLLRDGCAYKELGDAYLDGICRSRTKAQLVKRLERLGYRVALEPLPTAA